MHRRRQRTSGWARRSIAVLPDAVENAPTGADRGPSGAQVSAGTLEPTPAAGEELKMTPEETAGPFFQPNSPLKKNFREPGVNGAPINVTGFVLDRGGKSVPGVLLDFWHADGNGEYDLHGFRCRGHQFSDSNGRYILKTVLPGLYPGRTRHYRVRLQAAMVPY